MTLDEELRAWVRESRRFRAFAEGHADKIGKKLRAARDAESSQDLRAELNVARSLMADRRFELEYEAYGAGRLGPDFRVAFRRGARFNVEVTRIRGRPSADAYGRTITAKLRQLPSGAANVLILAIDGERADATVVAEGLRSLRQRADRGNPALLRAARASDTRVFYGRFLRLSAVVLWAEAAGAGDRASSWINPSARTTVPLGALLAIVGCLGGPGSGNGSDPAPTQRTV